jgi:nitroreductase
VGEGQYESALSHWERVGVREKWDGNVPIRKGPVMDIIEAMRNRKSIRAYNPDPVSKKVMTELLEAAILAPSGSNMQPWKFYVVAGDRKKRLDDILLNCLSESRKTSNELQVERDGGDEAVKELLNSRRTTLTRAIMELLMKNDLPLESFAKGSFKYFDAPVSVFVTLDQSLGENNICTVGAAVQNLMLLAVEKGLGTCWIGMPLMYAADIKKELGIPDTERIITSLALGYPDDEAVINSFKATKDPLDSFVEWIGWE